MGTLSLVVGITVAAAVSVGGIATALAEPGPDLHAYTAARFVPFANPSKGPNAFTDPPKLSFLVQAPDGGASRQFTMIMDTGTNGVVISASDLPGYTAVGNPQGWEFLSSSKLLWVGHWIPRELVFLDASGNQLATATVPVLAVETQYTCPGWSELANQPACADSQKTVTMPAGIAYMGVGFGREHDGQPQGTPDKNPLLNLTAIDGEGIRLGTYRAGYIITPNGVHVGLSAANSRGFAWLKLHGRSLDKRGNPVSDDPRDWPQASMAVSVNGGASQSGSVLIDTGIAQMYLTVSHPSQLPTQSVRNPSLKGAAATGLASGAEVTVSFPGVNRPVAQYSFTVGDTANEAAPSVVLVTHGDMPAFVNTGRHLLRAYEVAFDADGGWFGFRKVVP
jgi:hypothetical protein